jgi:hypothetical protein
MLLYARGAASRERGGRDMIPRANPADEGDPCYARDPTVCHLSLRLHH